MMRREQLVVKTKLAPPRPPKRILPRPRLLARIMQAKEYRLTIVHAGAGYGKTTALAALAQTGTPLVWYHLNPEDADPLTFLNHLLVGFRQQFPHMSDAAAALLENWDGSALWETIVDMLANSLADLSADAIFLVLDDAHTLSHNNEVCRIIDRLILRAPHTLHTILSTRVPLTLPNYINWKMTDRLLEIGQSELAFTPSEIAELFNRQHNIVLTKAETTALAKETQGWAIALQLVRQGLQANPALTVPEILTQLSAPNQDIFAYLAQNILQQQPPAIQEFLLTTAVLRQMTAQQCDCLRAASDSAIILKQLVDDGVFIVNLGNGMLRYHPLFHNLLKHRLAPQMAQVLHRRAAACCAQQGDDEGTIHHFLQAGAFEAAAEKLADFGRTMVWSGRLDALNQWMALIPEAVIANHPPLLIYRGDIARLHSQFDAALGWYRRAETLSRQRDDIRGIGRALRGQARVYLDTVNPTQAEKVLEAALRLTDSEDDQAGRTRLLNLLAENMLNLGQLADAERFRTQAQALEIETPRPIELTARVLLRTGRLQEAQHRLQRQLSREQKTPVLRPRGHRETLLLLSLVASFLGNAADALEYAVQGTQRGEMLQSPFITAVGYMRRGHAHLLQKNTAGYRHAIEFYEQALTISDTLMVPRLKPEAFWGLCQAYGFQGDTDTARNFAEQGIAIVRQAGDEWLEGYIRLTMGAGYALVEDVDAALMWLNQAGNSLRECSDPYGESLVHLWRGLVWHQMQDTDRLTLAANQLLQLTQKHQYDFLFARRTFLSPPSPKRLMPLLLQAKQQSEHREYTRRILESLGMAQVERHPGYQLRVETLGHFAVSLGDTPLPPQAWQRKKSRRLFQLFITHRHTLLSRDRIIETLWFDLPPEKARRDFKVALSTLNRVLEPDKPPRAPSAFIVRDGDAYGLHPHADIWLDADDFIRHIKRGNEQYALAPVESLPHYRRALAMYRADYLPDAIYDDWSSERREQLLALFLRTAERVARIQTSQGDWETVIRTCETILTHDDCWEEAYRLMMTAYAKLGNRAQVLRTFHHCTGRLQTALGLAPSPETTALFHQLSVATDL